MTSDTRVKCGRKTSKIQTLEISTAGTIHSSRNLTPRRSETVSQALLSFETSELTLQAAPSYLLTVEMEPSEANEKDFDDWYRQEHLNLLSKLPGYRRSLRYVIGPKTYITQGEPPKYLAIHEIDNVHAFDGKEAEAANTTPWTTKHIQEAKTFIPRMWEKVTSQGF